MQHQPQHRITRWRARMGFDAQHERPAVLLDRLWPRGIAKEKLASVAWEKDATPSGALRQWLHADPAGRFAGFSLRFAAELQAALQRMRALTAADGRLVLLTAAKDLEHSHLAVLGQTLLPAK